MASDLNMDSIEGAEFALTVEARSQHASQVGPVSGEHLSNSPLFDGASAQLAPPNSASSSPHGSDSPGSVYEVDDLLLFGEQAVCGEQALEAYWCEQAQIFMVATASPRSSPAPPSPQQSTNVVTAEMQKMTMAAAEEVVPEAWALTLNASAKEMRAKITLDINGNVVPGRLPPLPKLVKAVVVTPPMSPIGMVVDEATASEPAAAMPSAALDECTATSEPAAMPSAALDECTATSEPAAMPSAVLDECEAVLAASGGSDDDAAANTHTDLVASTAAAEQEAAPQASGWPESLRLMPQQGATLVLNHGVQLIVEFGHPSYTVRFIDGSEEACTVRHCVDTDEYTIVRSIDHAGMNVMDRVCFARIEMHGNAQLHFRFYNEREDSFDYEKIYYSLAHRKQLFSAMLSAVDQYLVVRMHGEAKCANFPPMPDNMALALHLHNHAWFWGSQACVSSVVGIKIYDSAKVEHVHAHRKFICDEAVPTVTMECTYTYNAVRVFVPRCGLNVRKLDKMRRLIGLDKAERERVAGLQREAALEAALAAFGPQQVAPEIEKEVARAESQAVHIEYQRVRRQFKNRIKQFTDMLGRSDHPIVLPEDLRQKPHVPADVGVRFRDKVAVLSAEFDAALMPLDEWLQESQVAARRKGMLDRQAVSAYATVSYKRPRMVASSDAMQQAAERVERQTEAEEAARAQAAFTAACVICKVAKPCELLRPCDHMPACVACTDSYEAQRASQNACPICPLCKSAVEERVHVKLHY